MANSIGIAAAGSILLTTAAAGAEPGVYLRAGQEVTLPVTMDNNHVVLGAGRVSKLGTAQPRDGEITIGLTPGDATLYARVIARERTSVPIDFVATGWVGEIKIDERVLCGRLGEPIETHIGSVSWRVSLHDFTVGKGTECR